MTGRKKSCPQCGYEVVDDDLFCASCGERLFEFRIDPPEIAFYLDPDASGPMIRPLAVGESSWGHPSLECVDLPPWLTFDFSRRVFVLDAVQLPVGEASCTVGLKVPYTDVEQQIHVWVAPLPEPVARPLTLPTGYASGVPAELTMEIWSPVVVERLTFSPPFLEWTASTPQKIGVGSASPISLIARVPPARQNGATVVTFTMKIRDLDEPVHGDVEISFQEPPSLYIPEIDGEHAPPVLNYGEGEFFLTCENRGRGATLVVDELTLVPRARDGQPLPAISFSRPYRRASIEKQCSARFAFRAEAVGPVAKGTYFYDVVVRSNDPSAAGQSRALVIRVTENTYRDYVALDFGTIDSTIAVFDDRVGPVNLLLEDSKDPKIYSNVYFTNYLKGQDPEFEWQIGARAAALGANNQKQLVTAAKIRMGTSHKESLVFKTLREAVDLETEKVVALAMRSVLARARLVMKQRLARMALCVPTRFTLRRKQLLRDALREAARQLSMEVGVRMFDESLAAGAFSLASDTAKKKPESYMMVVDFGGGTTDVTVFRVKRAANSPMAVDIVGAWGDPHLGGEQITEAIARELLALFVGKPDSSPAAIRQIAPDSERLKVAVSELEDARSRVKKPSPMAIVEALDPAARSRLSYLWQLQAAATPDQLQEPVSLYLDKGVLPVRSQSYGEVVKEFPVATVVQAFDQNLDRLKQNLRDLLHRIAQAEGIVLPKVDLVLLAGQSSRFPTVMEKLRELGTQIDFIRDSTGKPFLKECVSQGALMLAGETLNIQGEHRLWTRLGYTRGIRFVELIAWGAAYPCVSAEETFTLEDITGGRLAVTIKENQTLNANWPTERFGEFSVEVGDAAGPFYFRLRLDQEAAVLGECRSEGETDWRPMAFST
jgi:molecular chaperone DnaK (HSP70)